MTVTVPEEYTLKNVDAPTAIASEEQYDLYVRTLMQLDGQSDLTPEEASYAKILMALIQEWDEKNHPVPDATPAEVLASLLEANGLRQKDLARLLGSESVVSEVLSGKRELNVGHIRRLGERFHVSPAAFFPKSGSAAIRRPKPEKMHANRSVRARNR